MKEILFPKNNAILVPRQGLNPAAVAALITESLGVTPPSTKSSAGHRWTLTPTQAHKFSNFVASFSEMAMRAKYLGLRNQIKTAAKAASNPAPMTPSAIPEVAEIQAVMTAAPIPAPAPLATPVVAADAPLPIPTVPTLDEDMETRFSMIELSDKPEPAKTPIKVATKHVSKGPKISIEEPTLLDDQSLRFSLLEF